MAVWQWLLDSAGVLLLVVVGYGLLLVVRRRVLARNGGTFELSVRVRSQVAGRGWVLGLGRYHGDQLQWFRIFSPWPRPRRCWARVDLEITGSREPTEPESFALYSGHRIVECRTGSGPVQLAMSVSALTGFSAWLEAAPPGTDWDQPPAR
ncbi:DUF2550 domain-containing protein [Nocardioides marmorisolisilvae]|uniref:DUF2550 family protein n=1 Tax=Nocardioides marmorisolisilvae TaxID=1542737 RepID=A0A3N0DWM8_9ACTN|nr:DUF2550 domain-containing protein [Nocardioides marmorisolisilvae]RNL80014.1 DUF2550 family protein [Nocardioides marmorisolisilvae]